MATRYLALLRGINVGGNNIIPMAALRDCVADLGAADVATYIQSGNVLFDGGRRGAAAWTTRIEAALSERFGYAAMGPREGVDSMAAGDGVVYFERLTERAAQSALSKVVSLPVYREMTIRNWRTTTTLLSMMDERAG